MKFEMKGFDKVTRRFKDLERRARNLDGEHRLPLVQLLTPVFVRANTKYGNLDELIQASGFKIATPEDFKSIPDAEWDAFIMENTKFATWKEMLAAASTKWAAKKLGF
ncbi:hypothetical protein ACFL2T_00260 [Elusimicrobiota bacterium]